MSNPKNAISQIKNLMKQYGFLNDEPTLQSFKLEDNTIVETLKLKAGERITKVNDEFNRVALESGSYRLVENFEIEVKEGKIMSVKEIFVDAKLVDGTVVKVEGEEVVEGAAVKVVTEDAELPAPDGVHELEGGMKIETKDGVIVKIEEKTEAGYGYKEKDMEDVEVPVEVPAEVAPVAQEVVEAIVEALVPLMDEVKVLVEEMKKMKEGMKEMKNDFNAFKKQPAGKKISDGKTDFNKEEKLDSVDARIASIMSMRKK
jgi:hypothetical protein